MNEVQFHSMDNGRRIAFRHQKPIASGPKEGGPTIVFLPGYMSDMDGGKATALIEWAGQNNCGCLLLDYSGCGRSEGDFADGTLTRWRDEVLGLIEARGLGEIILIGSSMGGWLMLLVALALNDKFGGGKLAAMVGIASAPDFTDWGRSDEDKARLKSGETVFDPNPYGPEPTPMHAAFWADGQSQLLLSGEIPIQCPVRLIHSQSDQDVPWQITMQIAERLRSDDIQITLVKGGDHRLSRDSDIALLISQVQNLLPPE